MEKYHLRERVDITIKLGEKSKIEAYYMCTRFHVNRVNCVKSRRGGGSD